MNSKYPKFGVLLLLIIFSSCNRDKGISNSNSNTTGPLFTLVPSTHTNVYFKNEISESINFNFIRYPYIYNGGGVAVGDINNDGLQDIYFSSNQKTNKLYLNKGDLQFEDITAKSSVADINGWTTGVSMIDINNDGLLDIYVCKSGSIANNENRRNKLYVNQGNNSFKELARNYGIDDMAYSSQAYFFDYDKDGDNDLYLVNHRVDFENNIIINSFTANKTSSLTTDKLYRFDGNKFTDVTQEAGLLSNTWGLSASIADYNNDGWNDIYVCNDFILGDQLWINNQKGGFDNKILEIMDHTSFFSMGSDIADINNDQKMDLVVVDMVSEDHIANKKNMAAMSSQQFHQLVKLGHHHQYMSNMLQLNQGNNMFSDIGIAAGISNTDWSWAPLIVDFDNDGLKDLFITNGIKRDMTDNDYKIAIDKRASKGQMTLDDIFGLIPSRKIKNYIYQNNGHSSFDNKTDAWGLTQYLNSNGAAYADFDNDGDLDLVTNNLDDFASVYKNNSSNNYIKLKLAGPANNILGIGSKVTVTDDSQKQTYQYYLTRGFQSSVGQDIIIGIGSSSSVQTILVEWPDGNSQTLSNVKANTTATIKHDEARPGLTPMGKTSALVSSLGSNNFDFKHQENEYDDFIKEVLLPHKYSTLGPKIIKADVNGDGMDDAFVTGSSGTPCKLFIQKANGGFEEKNSATFKKVKSSETVGALFIDGDNDNDIDIYIVNGGNEKKASNVIYKDYYFINDGKGNFNSSNQIPSITSSGKSIAKGDYDNDGDLDIIIGGRVVPGQYPLPASTTILENKNGKFLDVTEKIAPDLKDFGLVTDIIFSDYDNDSDLDILAVGEWMPLTILENNNNIYQKKPLPLESGIGWWYSIEASDIDQDGDTDYVLGNLGLNNKFGAHEEKPFHVFCGDFDDSGNLDIVLSKEKEGKFLPVRGRECSSQQMPFIKEKFPTFKSFAEADLPTIYGSDKLEKAVHYEANNFESIVMINDGEGHFQSNPLPIEAQFGPTLCIEMIDINKDGNIDIVGAGNIYNTEVETLRYDASKGYILLGDGKGNFEYERNSGFLVDGNVKDMEIISVGTEQLIVVAKNDGPIEMFKIH